jgi:Ca2+/H+ antiporter
MAHLIHHWTTLAPLAAAALLVLTTAIGEQPWLLVSVVTLGTGRTSMMQGAVHLVLFATYLFLACVP